MPRQKAGAGRAPFTSASRSSTQKANRKRKQRGLDAFAIANAENPERNTLKRHRFGEAQQGSEPQKKRRRTGQDDDEDEDEDDDEDDDDEEHDTKRSRRKLGDQDGLDVSGGSDSDGHEWRMGEVSDDEDEDLDSDEAFGESDEERYEGFTFRGSSSNRKQKKPTASRQGLPDLNLDETEAAPDGDSDDDSLGEEAVDLATMLDDNEDSEGSEDDEEKSDDASEESDDFGPEEEDDMDDADKLERLQDLVSSLPQRIRGGQDDEDEQTYKDAPSNRNRLLNALSGMSNLDPAFSRSAKRLVEGATGSSKGGKASSLLKVPLPKRQQDRLDREAAYAKAKETLNRWIDTVKHNRRADHLSFPLRDPDAQEAQGTTRMVAAGGDSEPKNELESAIQTILQESGLASARGTKGDEENIRESEELQAKKMPVEEVMARRAELRKQRELLFREEIRAKRIKKIKSKAYRRVHRKERAKLAEKERDLLAAAGLDDSEAEREQNDRRRAEERMGARHRESKWAKGVKKSGRGAWDDDARAGVTDMARRNEELRKRIEGRSVRTTDDDSADPASEVSDDDSEASGDDFQLRDTLEQDAMDCQRETGLSSMKFMQRADAAKKRQNDEAVASLRRTLDGASEDEEESSEPATVGRRSFGPSLPASTASMPASRRNELEEGPESESDREEALGKAETATQDSHAGPTSIGKSGKSKAQLARPSKMGVKVAGVTPRNALAASGKESDDDADPIRPADLVRQADKPSDPSGWRRVQLKTAKREQLATQRDESTSLDGDALIPSNQELVKAVFGGDEDEDEFEKEKRAIVLDEDEKTINNALPGWGSWVGEGMSKTQQRRNKPRKDLSKVEGVAAATRKDAKLARVIVSEKRIKKNAKYLAPSLPHPFESRQQYERSLRVPIGPEWTTKESFQTATKPRVMVKQGIIKPMAAPSI